jgi:hypothetical protein
MKSLRYLLVLVPRLHTWAVQFFVPLMPEWQRFRA